MDMTFSDYMAISMLVAFVFLIFTGFPVAFILAGLAILYTAVSIALQDWTHLLDDTFYVLDWGFTSSVVERNWAVMESWVLVALPMFIFMGLFLEKSGVARDLMVNLSSLLGRVHGGLAVSVAVIGILLAASTGIIGASVVLLTLMGLPAMLEAGYNKAYAAGVICAVGTLGILVPPSIMLVLMADRLAVSVGDLFLGAMLPGLMLGLIYVVYLLVVARLRPELAPNRVDAAPLDIGLVLQTLLAMAPPLLLILAVLGSIFFGIATPTEASGVGAICTVLLTVLNGRFNWQVLRGASVETMRTIGFIFGIMFGATAFALVFRGLGGDDLIRHMMTGSDWSATHVVLVILLLTFVLGFFLDWLEITLILLPLIGPSLVGLGVDLVWFGILFAMMLQTSFITPPVGPAIFFAQGVAPPGVRLTDFYYGIAPYVVLQLLALAVVFLFPQLATWLPSVAY